VQFTELVPEQNADELTLHLLVLTQGIAVVAHTFMDQSIVHQEVARIHVWLDELVLG
jgi:hypothetical protein